MSDYRVTMPKEKPNEDKADFIISYRNSDIRAEIVSVIDRDKAENLWLDFIRAIKQQPHK